MPEDAQPTLKEAEVIEFDEKDQGPEFTSQIETVKKAKELLFEPAPGFGKYRIYYPKSDGKNPDAVAHPAKMHTGLCEYLITRYTQPGEVILDPMSGAGTTAAVGAPLGRNVVTVELEQKFVDWQKGLKAKIEEAPMLMKGDITVIKGDARKLTELIGVVDAEISSPPYSASLRKKNRNVKDLDRLRKAGYSEKWIQQHHDQPNQNIAISGQGYSQDPNNIGNLSHGGLSEEEFEKFAVSAFKKIAGVDGIVTSPPYSLGIGNGMGAGTEKITREKQLGAKGIGSYAGAPDAIVTSPPYNTRTDGEGLNKTGVPNVRGVNNVKTRLMEYSKDRVNNIGEIRTHGKIDAVLTSPPYSDALGKSRKGYTTDPQLAKTRQYGQDTSDENIGNLKMAKAEAKMPRRKNGVRTPARAAYFGDYGTGTDPANIGSLPIDSILTSPPYEGSEAFMDTDFVRKISGDRDKRVVEGKNKGHLRQSVRALRYKTGGHVSQGHAPSSAAEARFLAKAEAGRVEHPDSLGKLKKESYLEAMKKVYQGMFDVLKPGGLAVIVIKPFNRNKKVVDLPWQTFLLLHAVGFEFEDVVKMRIRNLSFWRIMQYRRHPSMERIRHEYAIVVRKVK